VVHAGHLGGFAADERAACEAAAMGDAVDDGCALLDIELAGGKIVEEEERLGALDDKIVDAHGHEILADRVVLARIDGNLELGAHAVIGGNEDRIDKTGGLEIEETAETADLTIGARAPGGTNGGLDCLYQCIAGIDIDPGLLV
jgi:hypothetical protein